MFYLASLYVQEILHYKPLEGRTSGSCRYLRDRDRAALAQPLIGRFGARIVADRRDRAGGNWARLAQRDLCARHVLLRISSPASS